MEQEAEIAAAQEVLEEAPGRAMRGPCAARPRRADLTAIRAAFGIAPELYKDFAQLRRKVLERAKAEIDQVAHFTVDWREIRRSRAVIELAFQFLPKDVGPPSRARDVIRQLAASADAPEKSGSSPKRSGSVADVRSYI